MRRNGGRLSGKFFGQFKSEQGGKEVQRRRPGVKKKDHATRRKHRDRRNGKARGQVRRERIQKVGPPPPRHEAGQEKRQTRELVKHGNQRISVKEWRIAWEDCNQKVKRGANTQCGGCQEVKARKGGVAKTWGGEHSHRCRRILGCGKKKRLLRLGGDLYPGTNPTELETIQVGWGSMNRKNTSGATHKKGESGWAI